MMDEQTSKGRLKDLEKTFGAVSKSWNNKGGLVTISYGDDDYIKKVALSYLKRISRPTTIVDFGCGSGKLLSEVHKIWPESLCIGVEITAAMAKAAKDALGKEEGVIMLSPIEVCPVPEESVDLAICKQVLHHVPDPMAVLARIHAVLKEGGKFVAMVPGRKYQADVIPFTEQNDILGRYGDEQLEAMVKKAGFIFEAVHRNQFPMEWENLRDYFEYVRKIGTTGKLFGYNEERVADIQKFEDAFGFLLSHTGPVIVTGEYITIESTKRKVS